ncbi:aryl-alcohol dehydrogenase-like predicted oxidoreductase [Brevirhabdus pacifica]|nr:aldo/keto reductase [Brevirhabdus pacifica]PJJ78988.1 aryl-alcohol dehydrogenase-like predicted oxidoreductase [Brevirhabdus pacifica]
MKGGGHPGAAPAGMKLALGGAQFGMAYGATNTAGQPDPAVVAAILDRASAAGIDLIDTAPAYGSSEAVIGAQPAAQDFRVVTKTPAGNALLEDPDGLETRLRHSLAQLGRDRLEGLLFHNADVLLSPGGETLFTRAEALREAGLVARIGVSVYDAEQIRAVLARHAPQIVQLPMNVLDQRLIRSGVLDELAARGIELHVRSAFLQGVLLADPAALPGRFDDLRPHLTRWRHLVAEAGLTPAAAALGFLRSLPQVERIVVGVQDADQLDELIAAHDSPVPLPDFSALSLEDPQLVDPRHWRAA